MKKGIEYHRERPMSDGSLDSYIGGTIYCEDDRVISVVIIIDASGRVKHHFVNEGHR